MSSPDAKPRGWISAIVRPFLTGKLAPLMLLAALALGALSIAMTPREEDPQIVVPLADIFVQVPGAEAAEVEAQVARPLENLLWQIDGVEYVYSMARRGMAIVTVRFFVGEDRERSLVKLHNRVSMHLDQVPPGVRGWVIQPREIDDVPILTVALSSNQRSPYELRRLGEEVLADLETLEDLSRTRVVGGNPRRLRILPDPQKLSGHGVTLRELAGALMAADESLDSGSFAKADRVIEVSAGPFLESASDLQKVVVGVQNGSPIYLEDVAEIVDGPEEPRALTRIHFAGSSEPEAAVTLALSKKKGTNAVTLTETIRARLEGLRQEFLPPDVKLTVTRDRGITANEKVEELLSSLVFAVVSVVILIAFSMGLREGLVVAAAVPVSFALALSVNYFAGFTINRVTLFALILSLGLVVDDPITNVDNIQRHLLDPNSDRDPLEATLDAVEEVLPPVLMSTLAILVTFLPLSFITGMMGPYMAPMALHVPLTVSFSTFAALTLVPWMAYSLLKGRPKVESSEDDGDERPNWIRRVLARVLGPFLDSRPKSWLLLAAVGLAWVLAMALPLVQAFPLKMLPFDNKDELQVVVDMPEGTTLERTDALVRELEAKLLEDEDVENVQSFVGLPSPMDFNGMVRHSYLREGPHLADIRLALKSKAERELQSHGLALKLRKGLEAIAKRHGGQIALVEVPPGPPVLAMVTAEVYGSSTMSHQELLQGARELRQRMAEVSGMRDLDDGVEASRTRLEFELDKAKAALHGVDPASVVETLRLALAGDTRGVVHQVQERQPLLRVLRLSEADRSGIERLLDLEVKSRMGNLVPLGELGRFVERPEDQPILHKNLRRVVFVTAEMVGRPPGIAVLELMQSLAQEPLSTPVEVEWAGEGEWRITVRVFRDLGLAFAVALFGIYLLLVLQTGSLGMPLVIMVAIPLTGLGVMPGFWLLNAVFAKDLGGFADPVFFTATAMIGMIALGGIVVRNSIVLIEFIEDGLRRGMPRRKAILESGAVRLRPIVLTALTTGIGALPITLDPIFSGLAWALIFGLFASTGFTLLVIPVVYNLLGEPEAKPESDSEDVR